MTAWLEPLLSSLERSPVPVAFFFRDDDAGWEDERLLALASIFASHATPLDVAAIPAAVSADLAKALRRLASSGVVSVHPHGFAHVDHEEGRRRSEFGGARSRAELLTDLRRGRAVLEKRLDVPIAPFFTPPWNRCSRQTAELLIDVGVQVLSRDTTACTFGLPGLVELPVRVDWARCWREGGLFGAAAEITRAVLELSSSGGRQPAMVGVMLHHAVMGDDELAAMEELLGVIEHSPAALATSMGALAGLSPSPSPSSSPSPLPSPATHVS